MEDMAERLDIQVTSGGVSVAVKAVPGASRDQIAGRIGARLKIRVSAAPEDGRANARIVRLLAEALGIARRDVTILSGRRRSEKTIRIATDDPAATRRALLEMAP